MITGSQEPVLTVSGLRKHFRSGRKEIEVLQGVDLTLRAGEMVSVRGESGCGKSTLLNLVAGIEVPDGGEIHWDGNPLLQLPAHRRPKVRATFLGFVFQSFYLIPELNTLENVTIAARIAGRSSKEAKSAASELLSELGLSERLHSRPGQLSGGERQRTAIARALVNRPKVLLADEPTGNLDEHTAERVMEQLMGVVGQHDTALLLVTHNPVFAARTARQYQLEEGVLRDASQPTSS